MKNLTLFCGLLFFTVSFSSCENYTSGCNPTKIAITSLEEEYNCENTKNLLEINLEETFTIITTQQEFENMVSGDCSPQIDFDSFNLLIGKKSFSQGNDSIVYEFVRKCTTDNLQLTVTFLQNSTTLSPNLTYHVLVPKLEQGETVEVTIVAQ
ncbi:MAG: hypothetical protein ACFB0A_04515 [Croceivirga sp.]